MQIFIKYYLKLYHKLRKKERHWDKQISELSRCRRFVRRFQTREWISLQWSYLVTLTHYYKLYWLLILPFDYTIRPYSMTCGGESTIETCFKSAHNPDNSLPTKARLFAEYFWDQIRGVCIGFGVVIALMVTLYATVFL